MSESNAVVERVEVGEPVPHQRRRHRIARYTQFTNAEWATIVQAAKARGKTPSAFLREAALGVLPGAHSTLGNAPLIRDLGRCGTALAALAGTARATGVLPEAASIEAALVELLAAVRRVDKPEQPRAAP